MEPGSKEVWYITSHGNKMRWKRKVSVLVVKLDVFDRNSFLFGEIMFQLGGSTTNKGNVSLHLNEWSFEGTMPPVPFLIPLDENIAR